MQSKHLKTFLFQSCVCLFAITKFPAIDNTATSANPTADIINLNVILPPLREFDKEFNTIGEINIPKLTAAVTIAMAVANISGVTAFAAINVPAGIIVANPKPMHATAIKSEGNIPTAKIKTIPIAVTINVAGIVKLLKTFVIRPNKMPVTMPAANIVVLIKPLV